MHFQVILHVSFPHKEIHYLIYKVQKENFISQLKWNINEIILCKAAELGKEADVNQTKFDLHN